MFSDFYPKAQTSQDDWIAIRAQELLLSGSGIVELLEEVQEAGGESHHTISRSLGKMLSHPPRSTEHETAMDSICQILHGKAQERARREFERHQLEARP